MCKYKLPDFGSRVLINVFLLLLFSDGAAWFCFVFGGGGGGGGEGGGENFKVRKIYSINCMFSACKQRDRYDSDI